MAETLWTPSAIQQERLDYRRGQARRSTSIAVASTLTVAVVAAVAITHSPGWAQVRTSFFNVAIGRQYFGAILSGLWLNLRMLALVTVLVIPCSLAVAGIRTLPGPVFFPFRMLASIYTDIFRGTPVLIALYLFGFGMPGLQLSGVPVSPFFWGAVALTAAYTAYVSEVLRAGIESIHPSQRAAARSLGLSYGQTLRLVILPQAIRRVIPPLLNDFVSLQKDVGLVSTIGLIDAIRQAQIAQSITYNFTPYTVAALLFIVLAIPTIRVTDAVSARLTSRQQGSLAV